MNNVTNHLTVYYKVIKVWVKSINHPEHENIHFTDTNMKMCFNSLLL